MTLGLVAVGGLAGVLARYGLGLWSSSAWTTVVINLLGCFVLGLLVTGAQAWSSSVRDGVGIGFCGGFTTFSTFAVQAVLDADAGRPGRAAVYLAVSVFGGLAAGAAGYGLGRAVS